MHTIRQRVETFLRRITRIGSDPNDSDEVRTQKAILVGASFLGITFGLLSAPSEFARGETFAGLITLMWAILTVIYLVDFHRARNLRRFRFLLLATVLLMPFLTQLAVGGYTVASASILWSFVSPLLAILTTDAREARRWFLAFVALVLIAVLLEPIVSLSVSASNADVIFNLVFAIIGVTTFVFVFATYLLREKNIAYQLLDAESAKTEELLLNVLPAEIVPLLKQGEETIAERFDSASVLFADFVGSTPLTEVLDPVAMIGLLNQIFSQFDLVAEMHDLEKIRTVGDNYMAAAGVPRLQTDHAQRVARAALAMNHYLVNLTPQNDKRIEFRFGISSGELVAGVVGKQKFHYDIWGDAVNVASRMESHGVPGKIQISKRTYDLIKDSFICERRGIVDIKGKGEMETWFLEGLR